VTWKRNPESRVMHDPKSAVGQRALPVGYLASRVAPLMGGPEDFLFRRGTERYTDQLAGAWWQQ